MAGYVEDLPVAQLQGCKFAVPPVVAKPSPATACLDTTDVGVGPVLLGQRQCTKAVSKAAQQPEPTNSFRGPIAATPFEEREPFAYTLWAALAMQATLTLLVAYVAECIAPMAIAEVGKPFAVTISLVAMLGAQTALSHFRHKGWRSYLLVAKAVAEGVSWGLAAEMAALPLFGPLSLGIWAASSGALAITTYAGMVTILGWIVEPAPEWRHASKAWLMSPTNQAKRRRSGLRKFKDMTCDEEGGMTRATCWFSLFAWMFITASVFAAVADTNPNADFRSAQAASVASFALLIVSIHGIEKQLRRCLVSEWVSAIVNVNNDFLHAVFALCTLTFLANPMEEAGGLARPVSLIDSVFLAPSFLAAMEEGRQVAAQMRAEASAASVAPAAAAPEASVPAQACQPSDRAHSDSETESLLRSVFRRRWPQQGESNSPSVA